MVAFDIPQSQPIAHADLPVSPGCYVLVADSETMRELGLSADSGLDVLYIGKAEDSIHGRVIKTHLIKNRTGSSTLRRSIGALLREKLELEPQPRSQNPDDSKRFTNYKFDDEGEQWLSDWITVNIRVGGVASSDPATTEADLIHGLRPPLNLTKLGAWANPDKEMIKRKRKQCADLARQAALGG